MNKEDWKRLNGLKRLIHDGVERGADVVEKHHRHAAQKPFQVLDHFRPIAAPTRVARIVHDGVLSLTYGSIRAVNRATGMASDWILGRLAPTDDGDGRKPTNDPGLPGEKQR